MSGLAQAMRALLERGGCRVDVAASGTEACAHVRARTQALDLIIADMHLDNGERGFEAIDRVQEEIDIPVPACIVTADYSDALSSAAAARGSSAAAAAAAAAAACAAA